MKRFSSWSIRAHLLLLVSISVLPALVIMLRTGFSVRARDVQSAKDDALRSVRSFASKQEFATESIRQLLVSLAKLPEVRKKDANTCRTLFQDLLHFTPLYAEIMAAETDGTVFASAPQFDLPISVSGHRHFREAVVSRGFSVGEAVIGRLSKRPCLHYAYPVLDQQTAKVLAVISVAFDATSYIDVLQQANLPAGTNVALTDYKHRRLFRFPYVGVSVGEADLPEMIKHMGGDQDEGTFLASGVDGVRRLYAFKRLRLTGQHQPYLYLRIGIPEEKALAGAHQIFVRDVLLLALAALLASVSALLLGNFMFIRRLDVLVGTSHKIEHGNLAARTGLPAATSELGQLANAIDTMASALEHRHLERKRNEDALRNSEQRYRIVADNTHDWEFWLNPNGGCVYCSPSCRDVTGYAAAEFYRDFKFLLDIIHPEDRVLYSQHLDESCERQARLEFRIIHADGAIRVIEHICLPVYDDTGKYLGKRGSNKDITERKQAEARIREMAYHDALTGLPNRRYLAERFAIEVAHAERSGDKLVLMIIDLDKFKWVNDSCGHESGDKLLLEASELLKTNLRKGDTVSRLGGDEFVLLLVGIKQVEDSNVIGQKIVEAFRIPFAIKEKEFQVTTSIGIAIYPDDGKEIADLLRKADFALYGVKSHGRDNYSRHSGLRITEPTVELRGLKSG